MHQPIQQWRRWLLRGLALKSQNAAADRRPHVGLRGVTIEWEALPRAIRVLKLQPAAATALRGVTIGDVVTQRQAKHWNAGDSGMCPFCSGEEEDETHRWFICPAWKAARAAAGFPTPALSLLQQLPQATAIWGIPVLPASVVEWSANRPTQAMQLPSCPTIERADMICVDGSGLYPKDSILRTVAWAMAWHDEQGWHTMAGPVPGVQTVPRSEACALLAAIAHMNKPTTVWSDCRIVTVAVHSIQRLGHVSPRLQKSPMADLLAAMVPHLRRLGPALEVRWMRSHGTKGESVAAGIPERAWEGNNEADAAAKREA